ncbi:hypothetical protein CSB08_00475 [Candidatus Gracilibacteria bacterium]|nr:MAG: hypothetical protein CSB08_00475 [Candidatus Gracilibacteria bacterium]PIE85317.1 MAG: hypothetical protein CSA08_02825 [Candidatus Gracilibacteria bacterium]
MSEALKSFDSQELAINSQERQEKAIRQETDRLYSSLDNFNLEQMQTLVDTLSTNNPEFKQELTNFQDYNSTIAVEMLKANNEINNNNSNFEYFGIDTKQILEIKGELDSLDLDLNKILDGYKNYIETNLSGLTKEQIDKVKLSISNRVLGLGNEIKDLKGDLDDGEDFKNNRWVINEKITDNFSDINNKLLPSLALLSKINSGENINLREEGLYDVRDKLEEIKKMLGTEVLSDGDFDKTWKSIELIDANTNNWNILDIREDIDVRFLEENGITSIENISLLSEKDKQIESTAQYTFYALLAIQIGLEFTPIGWTAGAGIDGADVFSDEDVLMKIATSMPWVDSNYKVEKTWIDNALATIGLIPGGTILTKSPKLVNWVFELEPSKFKEFMNILNDSLDEMAKNMGWNNFYVDKIKHTVESLFLGKKQGLPENYINAVEESEFLADNVNLLKRYKYWEKKGIDYNKLITDYVKNNEYGITVEEAHAIYGYTNGIFIDKLNNALRKAKTPEELQAIKDKPLVKYLISGLSKMPYANNRQFRGDDFAYENFNIGDEKVLKGFTS